MKKIIAFFAVFIMSISMFYMPASAENIEPAKIVIEKSFSHLKSQPENISNVQMMYWLFAKNSDYYLDQSLSMLTPPASYESPESAGAEQLAVAILGLLADGSSAVYVDGNNYVEWLVSKQNPDGSFQASDNETTNSGLSKVEITALCMLAIDSAGANSATVKYSRKTTLSYLLTLQSEDGSFVNDSGDTGKKYIFSTALAAIAIARYQTDAATAAMDKAFSFLANTLDSSGKFIEPANSMGPDSANQAAAIMAIIAGGVQNKTEWWEFEKCVGQLISLQYENGSFQSPPLPDGSAIDYTAVVTAALTDYVTGENSFFKLNSSFRYKEKPTPAKTSESWKTESAGFIYPWYIWGAIALSAVTLLAVNFILLANQKENHII